MGAAFGFGFLVAPELAAIGVLSVAENVLSTFPYMHQILYHYSMPTVPVLALGTVFAVVSLSAGAAPLPADGGGRGRGLRVVPVLGPGAVLPADLPAHEPDQPAGARPSTRCFGIVPPNAVVSAYYPYVAHLDHRTRIYSGPLRSRPSTGGCTPRKVSGCPSPARCSTWCCPSGRPVAVPIRPSGRPSRRDFVAVGQGGGVVVYRRGSAGLTPAPASRVDRRPVPALLAACFLRSAVTIPPGRPSATASARRDGEDRTAAGRTAYMTASIREWSCSFSRMLRMWFLTVFSEM